MWKPPPPSDAKGKTKIFNAQLLRASRKTAPATRHGKFWSNYLDFHVFDLTLYDFNEFDLTFQSFNEFDLTLHDFSEFDLTLHDLNEFGITLQGIHDFDITLQEKTLAKLIFDGFDGTSVNLT